MKGGFVAAIVVAALTGAAGSGLAQAPRQDVIWARSTGGAAITLNGVLSEPAWAAADSVVIRYSRHGARINQNGGATINGIPGSGSKPEAGINPQDSTTATVKFVVVGNTLYMGGFFRDKSVGGSRDFNRFDGLLMSLKNHADPYRPSPPVEYLYSWWHEHLSPPNDTAPGLSPTFRGAFTNCNEPVNDCTAPRTPEQIAAWDAVTVVHGISNDDNNVDGNPADDNDGGYTVEMKFDLGVLGYDVTDADGDVVEFNLSIYDCDWLWPFQAIFSANRVWWQNPWGNDAWFHNVRIHARPSVNLTSGPTPTVGPDLRIPNGAAFATPTINGTLTEPVWSVAPGIDIRWADDALRNTYPGMGPWRSGQYQATVNGGVAEVVDPADATVKWFFKGNLLYLGFDVDDKVVQNHPNIDRWDGFIVTLNEYSALGPDKNLLPRQITFRVGAGGAVQAEDFLPFLRDTAGGAQVALALKPGTTVDTVGTSPDVGYTAELAIDLTKMGYPSGLGDGRIFLGINHLDGDSFTPFTDSYGTRTWWQREYGGEDGPVWGYLDPSLSVDVGDSPAPIAGGIELLGAHPNPYTDQTSIRFRLDRPRTVALDVFDLHGRRVATQAYGLRTAGIQNVSFRRDRASMASGIYHYRLRLTDESGAATSLAGKMIVMR